MLCRIANIALSPCTKTASPNFLSSAYFESGFSGGRIASSIAPKATPTGLSQLLKLLRREPALPPPNPIDEPRSNFQYLGNLFVRQPSLGDQPVNHRNRKLR